MGGGTLKKMIHHPLMPVWTAAKKVRNERRYAANVDRASQTYEQTWKTADDYLADPSRKTPKMRAESLLN